MKIAYLILAHAHPAQLARLVSTLPADAPIFIHFDGRASKSVYAAAQREVAATAASVEFVRRHRCRWGAPGIMYGTLELIKRLTEAQINYDYATLLSGADYPIKPHAEIEAGLEQGSEYLECFPLLEPNRWSSHGGYFSAKARMHGRYLRFRSHIRRIGSRKMPAGITAYGGSQWWTLSRNAITYVASVAKDNRRLVRFLAGSFIPDEHFIQTILGNSPFKDNIRQDDLRFAIWDRPEPPYPATLTSSDLPALAASHKHFARKFDFTSHPHLADEIDADLLQRSR